MSPELKSPSQTSGPLFGFSLMFEGCREAVDPFAPDALRVEGLLLDGDGAPVAYPDGLLELWEGEQFARTRTDEDGRWWAVVRRPRPAPLPDGRPQAPHLNVTVFARGLLKQAVTRVYFADEPEANAVDPVLALVDADRRDTLVARPEGGAWRFDIRLQGPGETVFFAF